MSIGASKQEAVNQQGWWRERAVVAQNRGSVVLFWVPTIKGAVPSTRPPSPSPHPGRGGRGGAHLPQEGGPG